MSEASTSLLIPIISAVTSVGASAVSAGVSVWASRRAGSQKLAEMREAWIDDLRNKLAEFVGTTHRIMNEVDNPATDDRDTRLRQLNSDLMRIESYISMKINHEELTSKRLVDAMAQSRGCAAYISNGAPGLNARTDSHLREVQSVSRLVMKSEWNRVKNDVTRVSSTEKEQQKADLQRQLDAIPNSCAQFQPPEK
jgi:hypothetical protein